MTTAKKRRASLNQPAAPAQGMVTPPEIVAGLRIVRTLGEDELIGRCSHALQLLPNGAMLLLVTRNNEDETLVSTYLLGDEVTGFVAERLPAEKTDDEA